MNWVGHIIKNKLVVYILAIAICLAGLFCMYIIPVAPWPTIANNHMIIQINYPGANAATVQSQVTSKVDNALSGVTNINSLSATSQDGSSSIKLTLNSVKTNDILQTQIRIQQAIASSNLPTSVSTPVIRSGSGGQNVFPVIGYAVNSRHMNLFQINNFIQEKLTPKFSAIPGVSVFVYKEKPNRAYPTFTGKNGAVSLKRHQHHRLY